MNCPCFCHTPEGHGSPAIDCCEHCCADWKEHNDPKNTSLLGKLKQLGKKEDKKHEQRDSK